MVVAEVSLEVLRHLVDHLGVAVAVLQHLLLLLSQQRSQQQAVLQVERQGQGEAVLPVEQVAPLVEVGEVD